MKRLNKIARKITAVDEALKQFMEECRDGGRFNDNQIFQIFRGFHGGLTMEQIQVYAKPEFRWVQMEQIV